MNQPASDKSDTGFPRSIRLLRPYSGWLAVVVTLLSLLAVVDMTQPYLLMLLIDEVFIPTDGGSGNWGLLGLILPAMGLYYVTRNTLFYASRMRALRVSEDLCFDLRKRLFEHLQRLSLRFHRSNQAGRIGARLMDDTFKIQSFIHDRFPTFVRYLLELQVLLIIIYLVNWRLALASTIILPLHFWTYRRFRPSMRRAQSEAQEHIAVAHGNVIEKLLGIEVVQGFSAEDRESSSFRAAIDASRKSSIRSRRTHFAQKVVADLLVGLGTVLLLGYGAWEVSRGRMTGGAFFMFFWYVKMLYPAALEVISGAGHLSRCNASVDRVFEMLDEPVHEGRRATDVRDAARALTGRIEFVGVGVNFEDAGPPVLRNVSFEIKPGEHVAITGPSGSGKTTLLSLLPRFNDATSGEVLIDDVPIEHLDMKDLRGLYGLVFQEVFLFNSSISENLRYARPDATIEEVREACRITGADTFIERMPGGYETRIGASGGDLSRGEKQRITLARALLRDPRVLILDEATASLDETSAREIMRAILERMEGRTVVLVTHDTELLDLVDRVISLDDGRVIYDGPVDGESAEPIAPSPRNGVARATGTARREGSTRHRAGLGGGIASCFLAAMLTAASLLIGGCERSTLTTTQFDVGEARVSDGILLDEPDPAKLRQLADALDALDMNPDAIASMPPALESADPAPAGDGPPDVAGGAVIAGGATDDAVAIGLPPAPAALRSDEIPVDRLAGFYHPPDAIRLH